MGGGGSREIKGRDGEGGGDVERGGGGRLAMPVSTSLLHSVLMIYERLTNE